MSKGTRRSKSKKRTKRGYTKKRKTIKRHHYRIRGGNVDDLHSVDFNANLAYDSKQMGGSNIGANCNDPNFSIFNTKALQLFPYNAK
jgi:hypothetical protein